jgi:hypothetical protein
MERFITFERDRKREKPAPRSTSFPEDELSSLDVALGKNEERKEAILPFPRFLARWEDGKWPESHNRHFFRISSLIAN